MTSPTHNNGRRGEASLLTHNEEAEAGILGGILLRNEVLDGLHELETDDFFDNRHKVVFQAIRNLEAEARPIDVITLENEIARAGKLEAIGGVAFLGELALRVPTVDNVEHYKHIVRMHARNRAVEIALSSGLHRVKRGVYEPDDVLTETIGELQRIAPPAARNTVRLITVGEALEELESLARAPIYPTPFLTLNEAIGFGGLLGTQVYTLAAGTGRGKTSWVAELAGHVAHNGVPVLVVSYEMKPGYFIARKAAGELGVHSNSILRCQVPMGDVLATMPYPHLRMMHRPTLADLHAGVDRLAQMYGAPPLVIVDYLQKLADAIAATQQRPDLRLATTEASATLLEIAEATGSAILAVSAIGRGKGRALSTPRKLRPYELVEVAKESGAVEYDGAGMIVLTLSDDLDGDDRIATMTLAKARFGTEIHIDARYNGARGSWRDLGRVETTEAVETPREPEPRADVLKQRLIAELHKRPALNKTDLVERTEGKAKHLRAAWDELVKVGVIVKIGTGYTLSETGRQLVIEVTS